MTETVATGGKRILLVEDDRYLRKACETALRQRGFTVVVAVNGEEALLAIEASPPDLVLLDLLMPKVTGLEVLRSLRSGARTQSLPVLVLSNSSREQDVEEIKRLGVAGYYVKADLSLQELGDRVERLLRGEIDGVAGERILLAEDDRFLRKAAEAALVRQGFEVMAAGDGEEALSKARLHRPDLILLDLIMPGRNGFEVLESLRDDPGTSGIPVIVLSNLGQDRDVERAMTSGAVAYCVKVNLSLQGLVQQVKDTLAARAVKPSP